LPGADADIVIWDPGMKLTYGVAYAQHRTDYNLYEGWELTGYPEQVFLRGHLIVTTSAGRQVWFGRAGFGRYLSRQPAALAL
jgi:dihydropyrimidinase